jgi:hypothetical protein
MGVKEGLAEYHENTLTILIGDLDLETCHTDRYDTDVAT